MDYVRDEISLHRVPIFTRCTSYRTTCRNGMSFGMCLGTCNILSNSLRSERSYRAAAVRSEPHDLLVTAGAAS